MEKPRNKMALPRIVINISKIVHNFEKLEYQCRRNGVALTGVVKGIAGDLRIVEALVAAGLRELGDSRIENLERYSVLPGVNRVLLRLPCISKLEKLVRFADISLNSEPGTIAALEGIGGHHQIMLMVDLGDRREGVLENEILELAGFCGELKHIEVIGVGANFSCFAGVKPTRKKLNALIEIATLLKEEFHLPIRYVSGGNSSSLPLLYSNNLPGGINHLRVGEGILLGRETLTGEVLPDLFSDAFLVEAEVLQSRWKPACADGEIGRDAFGRKPKMLEAPDGYRLLINLGQQDTPLSGLAALEPGIQILGGSSDYLVLASHEKYKIGSVIGFAPSYWGLLALMTSPYVKKEYIF
jgi:predicted amino acid racemase